MEKVTTKQNEFLIARNSTAPGNRLQPVLNRKGVLYINDSGSTSVADTAMSVMDCGADIVLIIEGNNEANTYSLFRKTFRQYVKAVVSLNIDREPMFKSFMDVVPFMAHATSVKEAVKIASVYSRRGDIVLFSPATGSSKFGSLTERSQAFVNEVNSLDKTE